MHAEFSCSIFNYLGCFQNILLLSSANSRKSLFLSLSQQARLCASLIVVHKDSSEALRLVSIMSCHFSSVNFSGFGLRNVAHFSSRLSTAAKWERKLNVPPSFRTYAHRSRWSIGHIPPLAIALCSGLLWPIKSCWSLVVSALLQCLASNCCEVGLSSSSPAGSSSGLGVWCWMPAS